MVDIFPYTSERIEMDSRCENAQSKVFEFVQAYENF